MELISFHFITINILFSLIIIVCSSINVVDHDDVFSRSRRQLLYPNSSVLQLNIGVGTPTPIKTINVNWAFQANFQLPWNRSQIPIDIFEASNAYVGSTRKKRNDYESDAKLYHFYKYVEDMLAGYNGTACVLKALCQLGTEPLHSHHEDDLLYELATFVLNPENDIAESDVIEARPYVKAYNDGKMGENCYVHKCELSLIDVFSSIQKD